MLTGRPTLLQIIRDLARSRPDAVAITQLRNRDTDAVDCTFAELDRLASRFAHEIRLHASAGERVLIVGDNELGYISAFLGCLLAGVIAVPAATPRGNQSLSGLESIATDCGASAIISVGLSQRTQDRLQTSEELRPLHWIMLHADRDGLDRQPLPPVDPQAVAYLQYTSGSTGAQRGVMVTHENLHANQQMMAEVAGHDGNTCYVSWLPLFHDMGLVGSALQALYVGGRCVLMPARFFMQKPIRWLSAISRYRASSSAAPNFAYELCVRTIAPADLTNLDLSSWRVAISGGEPVRAETLDRFGEKFGVCGFRPEAWLPCYGLAEATCLVTGPPLGRRAKTIQHDGRDLVSCGTPRQGEQIVIVDPHSLTQMETGKVGEIWVHGPAVGRGYWGGPEENDSTFGGALADHPRIWLRTGDLGLICEGELFIAGRLKDLIIIRGRNYHPHAIETTVQRCNAAFADARGAAFAIERDSAESLVIVQEVARTARIGLDSDQAIGDIREAVSAEHGLQLRAILIVRPATLPITSSGKIQRRECRRQMQARELSEYTIAYYES